MTRRWLRGFGWGDILLHRFLNLTEENSESHPGRDNKNLLGSHRPKKSGIRCAFFQPWVWGTGWWFKLAEFSMAPHRFHDFTRFWEVFWEVFGWVWKGWTWLGYPSLMKAPCRFADFSAMRNIGTDLQALRFAKDSWFFHLKHLKKAQLGHPCLTVKSFWNGMNGKSAPNKKWFIRCVFSETWGNWMMTQAWKVKGLPGLKKNDIRHQTRLLVRDFSTGFGWDWKGCFLT